MLFMPWYIKEIHDQIMNGISPHVLFHVLPYFVATFFSISHVCSLIIRRIVTLRPTLNRAYINVWVSLSLWAAYTKNDVYAISTLTFHRFALYIACCSIDLEFIRTHVELIGAFSVTYIKM